MAGWLTRLVAAMALLVASATGGVGPSAAAPASTAAAGGVGSAIWSGKASYVSASYGDRYLALPNQPRGTRVRIVGRYGRVVRTSTDVGPDQSVFPDRVADLSRADFDAVCVGPGLTPEQVGVCPVTVEWLSGPGGPQQTLPPTDT